MSRYGEFLHLTIFGQSHAPAIGMILEGLPAGETIDMAALQTCLKGRHVDGLPGRQTLQNHADGRGMGLAEDGQMQKFSVPAHRPPPFNASKSSQKWG